MPVDDGWRSWRAAMSDALYGDAGFYRSSGAPARHFRTAAHVGGAWIAAILELAQRLDEELGAPADYTIVDVGAGGGELLTGLADLAPERWSLVGVDLAPRPTGLPDRVEWRDAAPARLTGLLLAVELLDVVPVDIVELTEAGPRLVEVSPAGTQRYASVPIAADEDWLRRWWPDAEPGDRIELGRHRDEAWHELTATVSRGLAVAIDYAVDPDSDRVGTLTGFRDGQQVTPLTDGSCDLTAHVHFDSLRHEDDVLVTQRSALQSLGVEISLPAYDGDPATYLASLSAAADAAELVNRDGLGGFTWLVHGIEINPQRMLGGGSDPELVPRRSRPAAGTSARTSSTHP